MMLRKYMVVMMIKIMVEDNKDNEWLMMIKMIVNDDKDNG